MFGYDNLFRTVAEVEIATMKTLADIGIIPKADIASLTPAVERELLSITTTEVDTVEREVTKHDIRAWVRIAQSKVEPGLRRWIHVPLTSYDALDTARALQFVRGHEVVRPTDKVVGLFAEQVNHFALQPQIGRHTDSTRCPSRSALVCDNSQPDSPISRAPTVLRKSWWKNLRRGRRLQRASRSRHRGALR